jgi:hypothetical protein
MNACFAWHIVAGVSQILCFSRILPSQLEGIFAKQALESLQLSQVEMAADFCMECEMEENLQN